MKTVGRLQFALVVAGMSAILGACRSTQSGEEPLTPASSNEPSSTGASESTEDDARPCQSNEDCGPGYACGFDHAISHVIRHCIAE